jgi:hypothetical protein
MVIAAGKGRERFRIIIVASRRGIEEEVPKFEKRIVESRGRFPLYSFCTELPR